MALQRPNISAISPFDATAFHEFTFYVISGDQVVANEIEIYNNLTGALVYTAKTTIFQLKHAIASNTLTNGKPYKIRLRTYNILNQCSEWSDYVLFWCLKNATITIPNIINGKISNQTYTFQGNYIQESFEYVQAYQFILYDYASNIITETNMLYDRLLQYEFTGFQNNTSYYIELRVWSENGLDNTSGKINFITNFIQPKIQSQITLSNVVEQASIRIDGEIIQVLGNLVSGEELYVGNEVIDLTPHDNLPASVICFNSSQGFNIADNFTIKLWLKLGNPQIEDHTTLGKLNGENGEIEIKYAHNRIHVYRKNGTIGHWANQADIEYFSYDTMICVQIQQIGGLIDVQVEKLFEQL